MKDTSIYNCFLALILSAIGAATSDISGPLCRDISFPITTSAKNYALPASVDPFNPITWSNFTIGNLPKNAVSGTFSIAGRYCVPEVTIPSRTGTLQLLVHGANYDRNYWSGLGYPGYHGSNYSWISYASKNGYATLSIDRLGSGISSHPDPISIVQLPLQVEVIHSVISKMRTGANFAGRGFSRIIYVGHSFGSVLGKALTAAYPRDATAIVLSGFSNDLGTGVNYGQAVFQPASVVSPSRFRSLNAGYQQSSSKSGWESLLYFNPGYGFDSRIYDLDWATQGTISIGEIVTISGSPDNVPYYTGNVFVLTGEEDEIFCAQALVGPGKCGGTSLGSIPGQVNISYPNAASFDYHVPQNTGHDINNHYSAQHSFFVVHDWFQSIGL